MCEFESGFKNKKAMAIVKVFCDVLTPMTAQTRTTP